MKKSFFNAFAKAAMIASVSLALVNCDDSTAPTTPGLEVGEEQGPQEGTGEELGPEQGQGDLGGGFVESSESNESNETNEPNGLGNSSASESFEGPVESFSSSSEEQTVESSSSEVVEEGGIFLANDTDESVDYMEVETIRDIEPCIRDYGNIRVDENGNKYCQILAYPKRLSDTKKHAVVVWGPGGGTAPGAYGGMINRLASHGFVVVALRESPGNGNVATEALNWLAEKNNTPGDPLYQKLDLTKVGCSGHSMGGLESEQALIKDERVITAMLNNSGDLGHSAMASVPTSKTIGIVYGEVGMEAPNAEADYNNYGVRAPACLIKMTGNNYGHGSGAWDGIPATVSWMRWHLGGEDFRKADFVGSSGKYINGPIYQWDWYQNKNVEKGHWYGQCKNFN
jgi:hypothetical protein